MYICIHMYIYICIYIYIYQMSNILINIISSLKLLMLLWNKIPVVAHLVTSWCAYRKSKMPYLNMILFWYCGNFLDKWKLVYLIKKTLLVRFVEPINWLSLYLSYNWIMQLLKTASAIFLYQQIIPLKKLRKMLFYLFHLKLFFLFLRYSNFYISLTPSFSPAIDWEGDRN